MFNINSTTLLILLVLISINQTTQRLLNVLVFSFEGGYSHIGSFMPLAKALSGDGFNVTFLGTNGFAYPNPDKPTLRVLTNVIESNGTHDALLPETKLFYNTLWTFDFSTSSLPPGLLQQIRSLELAMDRNKHFLNNIITNQEWDLILVDEMPTLLGNIYALKLQQERNVPFGMFVTARQADIHSETRAMGQSPAGRPLFFGPNFKDKEFVDVATFTYALKIVYEKFFERWAVLGWIDQKFQAFVGSLDLIKENIYSQQFIFKNAIFSIRDLPQSLFFPFTSAGDVINAGGHCKDVSNAQMSTNLKTIYDDGNINTIVYLAFGGSVRFFDAPPNVIASFLDLFEAFPTITFIWSYKGPPIVNLPGNAHLFEWVNQDAILSHEKTKLFISHSGLKSIKEGLCSEKAMLFMPVFAEQVHNAISANILWGAPFVNKFYVSGTELIRKVNGTLGNDVYGDKIKKTKAMMIDTIMDPLKESVWQVKKFLSEKRKVKFSKRKGMDVSWIEQFYGIEFGIFISIVVILAK